MGYVVMNAQEDLGLDDGAEPRAPRRLSVTGVSHASLWSTSLWNSHRTRPLTGEAVEVSLERVAHSALDEGDVGVLEVQLVQLLRLTGLESFTAPGAEIASPHCNSFQLVINDEVGFLFILVLIKITYAFRNSSSSLRPSFPIFRIESIIGVCLPH